jgi:hypothetical protein
MDNNQDSRSKKDSAARHPWVQLLEMEQQPARTFVQPDKKRGRPERRFPRTERSTIRLTLGEQEALDTLLELFKQHIDSGVVRADVIAFMSFRMIDELKALSGSTGKALALPPEVHSFTTLGEYLDGLLAQSESKRAPKARTDKGGK